MTTTRQYLIRALKKLEAKDLKIKKLEDKYSKMCNNCSYKCFYIKDTKNKSRPSGSLGDL